MFKKPQIVKEKSVDFPVQENCAEIIPKHYPVVEEELKIFPFPGRVGDTAHLTTGGQHLAPAQTQYSSTGKEKLKYTRNRILHIYPAKDVPASMCTGRREYTH